MTFSRVNKGTIGTKCYRYSTFSVKDIMNNLASQTISYRLGEEENLPKEMKTQKNG
jgi:hypothetical protein